MKILHKNNPISKAFSGMKKGNDQPETTPPDQAMMGHYAKLRQQGKSHETAMKETEAHGKKIGAHATHQELVEAVLEDGHRHRHLNDKK